MSGKVVAFPTTCSVCGDIDEVWAVPQIIDTPPSRKLWAFCVVDPTNRAGHSLRHKYLDCEAFVAEFPELARPKKARAKRFIISNSRRYEILRRDGYHCVFCRIKIERYAHPADAALSDPEMVAAMMAAKKLERPAELHVNELVGTTHVGEFEQRDLFGVHADHVFPVDWQSDMAQVIEESARRRIMPKCERDWIVSSCQSCNGGRWWHPEAPRVLLGIYARHLFHGNLKPDEGAYADLADFCMALRAYAFVRASRAKPTQISEAG